MKREPAPRHYPKKRGPKNRAREKIWLKLQEAKEQSEIHEAKKRPILKISRTVELVNQKDEGWREEKSKLLFMVGVGLTPILKSDAVILPSIVITNYPLKKPEVVQPDRFQAQNEQDNEEVIRKKKLREARVERFIKLREWRANFFDLVTETIEIIDLTSDDENEVSMVPVTSNVTLPTSSTSIIATNHSNTGLGKSSVRLPLKQVNHKRRTSRTGYKGKKRRTKNNQAIKKKLQQYGNDSHSKSCLDASTTLKTKDLNMNRLRNILNCD